MTCIVGLIEDRKIYIGGDSAATNGYYGLTLRKDPKVFRKGDFLIGCSGSPRMMLLLRHSLVLPEYKSDEDVELYMATKFVDAVRDCLKSGGHARKESEQENMGNSYFLVGFQQRLFCIYSDYQVEETFCGYSAIGSGSDIALGVLYATPDMQAMKRVELALKASEYHNAGVRAPYHIEVLHPVHAVEQEKSHKEQAA